MKKFQSILSVLSLSLLSTFAETPQNSTDPPANNPVDKIQMIKFAPAVAVLPFDARGREFENGNIGKSVSEFLSIGLTEDGYNTVERAELDKALTELHLSAVGLVDEDSQVKLGRLVGAKVLITGSVFKSADKNFVVAKIIGTETSRVVGASASGKQNPVELVPELKTKVAALLEKHGSVLLPKILTVLAAAEQLAQVLKGNQRKVYVKISENISVSVPDPAAQTEIEKLLITLGFDVVSNRTDAEFAVTGEAFAENAGTCHKFTSVAARVELNITTVKNNRLLASGARKERLAGASYQIAAKDAISQAAMRLAVELFPAIQ